MISFIVPAHNEELLLKGTLAAIGAAAGAALTQPFEVIVVNDDSTDATGAIARAAGATVIDVKLRHIAAVRNAGARAARGEVLIFVDADTRISPAVLVGSIHALQEGAVGGGAAVEFEGPIPLVTRVYMALFMIVWRRLNLAAGCYFFARRSEFEAVGGFDERYFTSEELHLSRALKQRGRFAVVKEPVVSSGRKARLHSPAQVLWISLKLLVKGPKAWQRREGLEFWYDGRREAAEGPPSRA